MDEATTSSRTKERKKERDAEVAAQYEASGDIDPMVAKKIAKRAAKVERRACRVHDQAIGKFTKANSSLGNDPAEAEGLRQEGRDLKRKAQQMMEFAQEKIQVANDLAGKETEPECPMKKLFKRKYM